MAYPIDIKLIKNDADFFDIDWDDDGDVSTTETYETTIFMSIFCERRAKSYEVVVPQYRRGWIGNLIYTDGSEDGCGLWLYEQRRLVQSTINGVRDEAEKGLLWFIESGYADQIDVSAEPYNKKILLDIVIYSGNEQVYKTSITV